MANYKVLLFYYYTKLDNPEELKDKHKKFCENLDLKGRIIFANEGINGTVSGLEDDCEKYKSHVKELLNNIHINFKDSECDKHLFDKLSIKVKDEIIKIGINVDPTKATGVHLTPDQFKIMSNNDDNIILDMRSNMEHNLGKFKNAVALDIDNFYDFPTEFEKTDFFKDKTNLQKKILVYCTGGIKCEKGTSYLLSKGFTNVFQLNGGIINYSMKEKGENFDGKCYVFDDRIGIDVNSINSTVVSKCYVCKIDFDIMVNCMNTVCNRHVPICKKCYTKLDNCCSLECSKSATKRKLYIDFYNQ
jgi:UPF0176 protein